VVRPTSETIINSYFAKWVQSYRDLPFLLNQWANVVRWELRPRVFLRTTEFLWQEGHTCHATEQDAHDYSIQILGDVYEETMRDVLAVPVLLGRKTVKERFAGASNTWTCEAMMADGKALQMGTSHELGQNFAKVFGTQYLTDAGTQEYVWQTSWGVSTRLIGGLIMTHGDDNGLRLPPAVAPVQVVVILVRDEDGAGDKARALVADLRQGGHRVHLDDRVETSFGRRTIDWELKGVPVRIEVGPRDLAEGNVTLVRRDSGEKRPVPLDAACDDAVALLGAIQTGLLEEARAMRESRTADVKTLDEAREAAATGFARLPWSAVGAEGEAELATGGITVRCLQTADGGLPRSEDEPGLVAFVARAY
jgi:prolyl-tRNA synthetase